MVVARDCQGKLEPAAAAAFASPAAERATSTAHAAQQSNPAAEGGSLAASITPDEVLVPAQPGLAVAAAATTSPSPAAPGKAARPLSAAAEPKAVDSATLSALCKWAEAAARVAAARVVALFFLSIWLAGAMWAFLLLNWAHIRCAAAAGCRVQGLGRMQAAGRTRAAGTASRLPLSELPPAPAPYSAPPFPPPGHCYPCSSSLLLHSLSAPLLLGMVLLLSGGVAATLYTEEQARSRRKATA